METIRYPKAWLVIFIVFIHILFLALVLLIGLLDGFSDIPSGKWFGVLMTILFIGYSVHLLNLLMFPVYLVLDEEGLNDCGTKIKWAEIEDIHFQLGKSIPLLSGGIIFKYRDERKKQKIYYITFYKYSGSNSEIMKTIHSYWLKYKEDPNSSSSKRAIQQ